MRTCGTFWACWKLLIGDNGREEGAGVPVTKQGVEDLNEANGREAKPSPLIDLVTRSIATKN